MFRLGWQLVLLGEELSENECPPERVKLFGEPLLAWRDMRGRYAPTYEFCVHLGRVWRGHLIESLLG